MNSKTSPVTHLWASVRAELREARAAASHRLRARPGYYLAG
jgi:hypothetical protein